MATGGSGTLRDRLVPILMVAGGYYGSAWLGLRLALVDDIVTPLWPPTGVAVVALWVFGYRMWPVIAIAALAVNLPIAASPAVAAGIAVGNTLAPLAAAALLRRLSFDERLARLRDAIVLVAVALASMTISASGGVASLAIGGIDIDVADTWWVWWAGDAMGVLIVAPVLWSLWRVRHVRVDWLRVAEAGALYASLAAVAFITVRTKTGLFFVLLPLIGWIAWRFQQTGAGPAGLIASVMVILAAADGRGSFEGDSLLQKMVALQAFNACVALTSLVFAASVSERRRVQQLLFEREHRLAQTLQRSLLPSDLASVPGVAFAASYVSSSRGADIGGDWYDVITFTDDKVGLVVGDVEGHGIATTAAMVQLRTMVRAYSLGREGPAATLAAVNSMAFDLHRDTIATLLYAEFDPGPGELVVASAGHIPPVLIPSDGAARLLEVDPAVPIGVWRDLDCTETLHLVPEGSTLVMFTDGLVESREHALDVGIERVLRVASELATTASLDDLNARIMSGLGVEGAIDDVALLTMRPVSLAGEVLHLTRPAIPTAVGQTRLVLKRWLRANGASDDEAYELLVAFSEAHTNAIRHAYRGPEGFVDITFARDGDVATVTVRDHGRWRERSLMFRESGGRGIPLIEALTDSHIDVQQNGTEIRMRGRLSSLTGS